MHRIGVIGPERTVERILEVAADVSHEVEFIPFPYDDEMEIQRILQEHRSQVKGWLFSGPVPYIIAQEYIEADDTVAYCQTMGGGFYLCCLQMAFEHKVVLERISVDFIEAEVDIEQLLRATGIPWSDVYIKYYNRQYDPEEIIQFHLQLWREGKIDGVITALRSVMNALQKEDVPVYHFTLSEREIYQSIKIIIEKVQSSYFKNTQVGLVIIEISSYGEIIARAKTPYDLQILELRLKAILLPLCKSLDGYLLDKGTGVYEIFSSRGAVQREITMLQDTIEQLLLAINIDVPVTAGIGFGETVFAGEINAHRALRNTKEQKGARIVIVQDDGKMVEVVKNNKALSYEFYSNDTELLKKLNRVSVGIKTYCKIENIVQRMGGSSFSISQLAAQMSVTERNVRRIITSLCEAGLVEQVGEEYAAARGRPNKLYQIASYKNEKH
ncbi:hypothetical protein [Pelosinus baikalensis]|uniref:Transcriptional regulator n=1 Tax=Pelosinus baikalensis TaxID=2892015 RepID=A0ABS8HLA0_9FIRM|nr:hypothetical protein [Pelosinus baikalensis]MCC5463940.1 hypothetical protein [Pelosinus baikalensis]